MAVNFSTDVYLPAQDMFGRSITVTPVASQPGQPAYGARGILDVEAIDVGAVDDSIVSETRIVLDIREAEFTVLPLQGDRINVPADAAGGQAAEGDFVVLDADPNGGGETTLTLRRLVTAKP